MGMSTGTAKADRLVLQTMTAGTREAQITRRTHSPDANALRTTRSTLQRLRRRGFAVCKNFRNYRRKFINSRARHDDAVAAAVSFLCDTQEPAALIFAELDIEVLALNLQFFRLDDVVHFALRAPSLGSRTLKWKKNRRLLRGISSRVAAGKIEVIDGS